MKSIVKISSFLLFFLISCSSEKKIHVLFKNNKTLEYTMKRADTSHTYKCKTEKLTDIKNIVRFKLCGEFFMSYKDSNDISKIDTNDFQKIKSISLQQFVEKYSNLKGANTTTQLFFIEKNTNNTYQKYRVTWSKDFIEYEPSQKLFEKF